MMITASEKIRKMYPFMSAVLMTCFWFYACQAILPFAFMMGMVFDNSRTPQWLGGSMIIVALMAPLSCVAAIVCIWLTYYFKKIKLMIASNLIPISTFFFVYVMENFLEIILDYQIR